jgi:hypothetical protein
MSDFDKDFSKYESSERGNRRSPAFRPITFLKNKEPYRAVSPSELLKRILNRHDRLQLKASNLRLR